MPRERHDFYEALEIAEEIPTLGKSGVKIRPFTDMIHTFRVRKGSLTLRELVDEVLENTGYVKELEAEGTDEAQARIENIDELLSKVTAYQEQHQTAEDPATLSGFLEEVALVADVDSLDPDSDYVVLMTLHSAKGLEFPNVYMAGMEDGLFPSYMTITSDDPSELEEERRLCYVGITRGHAASDLKLRPDADDPRRKPVQQDFPFCQGNPYRTGGDGRYPHAQGKRNPAAERLPAGQKRFSYESL